MTHHRIINGRFSSGRLISLFIMGFDSLESNIRVKWCMDPCYWMLTRPTLTNLDSLIYLVLLMSNQIDTLNKQIIIFPHIAYLVKLSSTRFFSFLGNSKKFVLRIGVTIMYLDAARKWCILTRLLINAFKTMFVLRFIHILLQNNLTSTQ